MQGVGRANALYVFTRGRNSRMNGNNEQTKSELETAEKGEGRLALLKARAKRCVCKYCGGKLELRRIAFSDYGEARSELYCPVCQRIEFGTEPEIYQSAVYFVDNFEFNHYPGLDANEKTRRMNIAKVCEIMAWGDKNIGLLTENGFTVPVYLETQQIGQTVIFEADDLAEQG